MTNIVFLCALCVCVVNKSAKRMGAVSGLFITGTGTGVGKTYVAAFIARSMRENGARVGVYKPVASGCEHRNGHFISPDAVALWEAAGRPGTLANVCPQMFIKPLAPHLAARAEGRRVDAKLLREGIQFWRDSCDVVLVEGAGGLMSPISDEDYNADLAADFGFPLLVVAANELGAINATLQTLITAATYCNGLDVAGIVLNSPAQKGTFYFSESKGSTVELGAEKVECPLFDASVESNADEIARHCVPPLLATVEHGGGSNCGIDWLSLCATACKR